MVASLPSLSWFFLFALALNGLVAISILIFKNKTMGVANYLLAINLLGISLASMMISLIESRLILEVPYLYRAFSPIYYLMSPAAYLYVMLIVKDRNQLKPLQYLHFIPALLHLVEMAPYYLSGNEYKISVIRSIFDHNIQQYAHSEGWLPAFAHSIIRGGMTVVYGIAMWQLIRKSSLPQRSVSRYTGIVLRWLNTFTIINLVGGAGTVILLLLVFIPSDIRSFALHLLYLSALLITNFYLFFRPEILYGLPQPIFVHKPKVNPPFSGKMPGDEIGVILMEEGSRAEIPSFIYQYRNQVREYLLQSKRYLEPDFSLHDLARDTNIPKHHIQLLIHKVEDKKFSEFINGFRIQYLKEQIEKGGMKNKTLEGLASESGFSSKASFIRAIKKYSGKTPKEYFSHQNINL